MQGKYENKNRETAVSEVLGAVMLIAVVVTAIAVIGVALTSQSHPEKIPAIDAIISSNGKDTIRIFHNGGDSLTRQEVTILVDGVDRTSSFTIQGSGWMTWSPGQSLDDNYGSLPGRVQLIYKSPSTQTVLVSADFAGAMPTYVPTVLPTPGAPATVTGISPAIGITGSSLPAMVSGSGFQTAATVSLVRGSAVIPAAGVMVISQNQITCTFNLNGAATGSWNVNVTNPASPSGTLTNGFTVIPQGPAPTVTRINPVSGNSGTSVSIGNLTGTGFVTGASVRLSRSGSPDLFAQNVNVLDATNLTCTFVLPGGTASGAWDITVRNTDGQSGTLSNGFTVTNPGPAVTGVTPATAYTGTSVTITNLAGAGFMNGATVKLNSTSDPTGITASDVVVITQNQISCIFDLTGAPLGTRNIVVTNTDGKTGILLNGFTVAGTGPLVTAVNPNSGIAGNSYSPVSIGGNGFLDGAIVKLNRTGSPDILATGVNVASSNFLTCTIPLPAGATAGPWNVTVTNPDGQTGSMVGGFAVGYPAPTVTARSNATLNRGWLGYELLTGTNFVTGAQSVLRAGTDIPSTGCVVRSSTQMFCSYNLAGVQSSPPAYQIVVINPDGKTAVLATRTVTLNSPAPTVTGITPNSGNRTIPVRITSLAGSGFQSDTISVQLVNGTETIPATNVVVLAANRMTCIIDLSGATKARYSVVVTNTDLKTGTGNNLFTITMPIITASAGTGGTIAPTGTVTVPYGNSQIFAITPNSGYRITNVLVDGSSVGSVSSYTFTNVQVSHTISATFAANPRITASAGTGGTISPAGTVIVPYGTSQTFTVTPNSGYRITNVLVDGSSVGTGSSYTFANVVAAHTISATFALNPVITASAGTGGIITPTGSVSVPYGTSRTFAISPNAGYRINSVLVDGISQGAVSSYTFTNVTTAHTISATFAISTHTIVASSSSSPGWGSISPSGNVIVNDGASQTFTITRGSKNIVSVVVDGVNRGAITTYSFTNVIADHTIVATFG